MPKYQVYSIDLEGGITGNRMIEAPDDDAAMFEVRAMKRQLNTEIWHGDRRVARIPGTPHIGS